MSTLVTPVILTLDEAPNLGRLLARLDWAREVLVVDSGSTDGTVEIAAAAPNVRIVEHPFEGFAAQWQYAIGEAGVHTPWVLALDADHLPDPELIEALRGFSGASDMVAYRAAFIYCIHGRPLRGSLYPPREVLLHREHVRFEQVGHKQVMRIDGAVGMLPGHLQHDDRKPFSRWLQSQWSYARQEAALIDATAFGDLSWSGRIRKLVLPAPPAAFVVAWFARGGIFDGRAGLHYALERLVAESLIAMLLMVRRMRRGEPRSGC